jgi:hypothetical protein
MNESIGSFLWLWTEEHGKITDHMKLLWKKINFNFDDSAAF